MTPSELRKLDDILDRSIGALARRHGFPGARHVLAKKSLAREPSTADALKAAKRAVPVRYGDGSDGQRELASDERWYHENISMRGKLRGVPAGGMAKAGSDRAIDTVVNRVLDVNLPREVRAELIDAIADKYFLGNTQKVLDWALAEREARDRRRNSFGKAGEPAVGVDRFGNQIPATSGRSVQYGVPLGTHIADRMHPMGGSGAGPAPQAPSSPDYLHLEDLKRGKWPFAPLWAGVG
jgi:hypothetical protein